MQDYKLNWKCLDLKKQDENHKRWKMGLIDKSSL